ncbi:MAG: UTP--glucose-1-phosphate uridylyltransferase [Chloroflexi bacterium]|jgi:UTP--glucose-1-phosphate uridylyltransferase|nr:UTP--glucose-1-phosphate uridylyltransferase [Chloroflexota bacterium]MBT4514732.1 UTP--glucose-1-phosphate uridylyltransferase [Chloroflexota bacterium]
MVQAVRKAVIPAAGLGTRFLPVTSAVPKPLLPVIDRPLIHYGVAELAASGIHEIAMVLSPGLEAVADYFRPNAPLLNALEDRGDSERLTQLRAINEMAEITVIEQTEARGLGHAVLMARDFIGDESFAVLLPDDLIWSDTPAMAQLANVSEDHGGSVVAAKRVVPEAISSLGIIDAEPAGEGVHRVRGLVEKPPLEEAPSDLAIIGRYILTPGVFDRIEQGSAGALGEIQLTDAIAAAIGTEPVHACEFTGDHIDAGTPPGMLAASLYEARKRPDLEHVITG